jgi:hypothetical protein
MTDREKHLEAFAVELATLITKTFNVDWKAWPRNGTAVQRAGALDVMAMHFDALASGLEALAERSRELAADLLDPSSG